MPNITVIDVDLGASVESIIRDEVTELTAENRRQIDDTIREAKIQQEAITIAREAKEKQEQAKAQVMESLFAELVTTSQASDSSYLSSQRIITIAAPEIANMISFVGRMRNWLMSQKKPYKLVPVKRGKETGYRLADAPVSRVAPNIMVTDELAEAMGLPPNGPFTPDTTAEPSDA